MALPVLVIITGPPGAGKTSLGRWLSDSCGLPLFFKDQFKEMMYDVIIEQQGIEGITMEVSRILGRISIECLQIVLEQMLCKGLSLIVEANFVPVLFSPVLVELRQRYPFHVVQALLTCETDVLAERFMRREREDRHAGHQGLSRSEEVLDRLRRVPQEPLDVEGDLLVFDTTDIDRVDYSSLFELVQQRLTG